MSKTVIILLFACIYILEPGASETDSRKALPLEMEVDWSQPKFISTPRRDHAAFLGGDMKLNCRAIAVPRPYVFWYRNGEMVNESAIMPRLRFSNDNMVLMIRRIEAPDHGKWACKVWNSAGSIWRNFTVEVLDRCIYFEHVKKEDPSITFPIDCKCLWLFDGRREILAEEETGTFDKSVCSELFPTKYRQWKLKYSPASDFAPPSPAISNAGNMASGNSGNSGIPKSGHPASDTAETASDNADVIGALLDTAIDGIADNAGTNSASRNVSGTSRNDAGNGRPSVITHTLPPPQMARTIVACADSTHGHNNNNTANTNSKAQPCAAATHETVDLNTQDAAATAEWLSEVAVLPQAVAQYFSEAQQNALRVLIHKEHELPGGFEDEQEEGRISEAQLMDAMAAAGLDEEEIAVDPARQAAVDFWNVPSTENLITTTTTQIRTTTTPTSTLPPWPPRPAINSLPHIAQPPYFKDSEPEEVVKAVPSGRTVTLKCHAQGYPEPQVVFYHWVPDKEEFVEIIGTSRRPSDQTYKVRKWTLELEDVVQSDSGLYSCLAFNRYGNVTRKFKLKIVERLRSRPLISRDYPKNTSVPIGGTAEFKCPTVSDLMALIRWVKLRNSTLLDENVGLNDVWDIHYLNYAHNRSAYDYLPRFVESGGSARNVDPTLTIFNVTREDAGVYICIAGNSLGTSAAHAWLSIEEPVVASWLSPVSYAWIWISAVVILFVAVMSAVSYKCARTYTRKITPRQERLFIEADPYDEEKDTLNTPRVFVRSPTGHNYDYQDEVMRKQATDVILEYPTDHWNINPDYLSIQHLIGEGAFGTVHLGELTDPETGKTMKVAVKMSKASATVEQVKNMYGELTIMKRIGRHENIINLIAASISPGGCSLQIIVEYCANGNLRHYLIDRRPKLIEPIQEDEITESDYLVPRTQQTQPSNLTLADLVGYSRQIAKGMEYLASRKCIHRDLAARNVLVTEDLTMKVADFGLARDVGNQQPGSNKIYYRQVYNRMMPVKWLAPEALEQYKYSTEGDVWSYGILLFEIFTMGGTPYSGPGRANNIPFDHLFTSLLQGYRMPQPHGSPDEVYALMRLCWEYEPQDRPTFTQITHYLDELLQVSEPQIEPPYVDIESVQSLTTDIYDMSTPRFDMSRNDSEAFRELNNNEPNFPAKLQPMYYTNVGPDVNDTVQLLLPSTHCNRQSSSSSANTSHSSFLALNNSNSNLNPANQLGGNNGNSNNLQARSTPHINGSSSGISSAGSPMASPLGVLNAVPPTSVAALSTITERSGANSSAQTLDMAQSGDHWRHRSPTSSSEESAECEFAISNARPPPAGMRFKRRSLIIAEQFPESVETIKLPNSDSGVNLPQNDREYAKIMKPSTSRLYKNRHEAYIRRLSLDDSRYANNLEVIDGKSNSLPQDGDVVVVESARNNQQTSSASSSGRGSGMIYSSIGGADLEIEHCDTNSIVDESKEMLERQKSQYVNIGERSRPVEVVNVHMRESMI